MNKNMTITGIIIEEGSALSYLEVCQKYNIPKELLIEMQEQGFFEASTSKLEHLVFNSKSLRQIEVAIRLHRDLGINLQGAALALELLETIDLMKQELEILRKLISNDAQQF
jgi:chaperone modulatory protein CbpM